LEEMRVKETVAALMGERRPQSSFYVLLLAVIEHLRDDDRFDAPRAVKPSTPSGSA